MNGESAVAQLPLDGTTHGAIKLGQVVDEGGEGLVDYVVGVVFLAVVLIVSLAVIGNQVAGALHHA